MDDCGRTLFPVPSSLGHSPLHNNPAWPRSGAETPARSHHRPRGSAAPSIPARLPKAPGPGAPRCRPDAGPGHSARCGPARVATETGRGGSRSTTAAGSGQCSSRGQRRPPGGGGGTRRQRESERERDRERDRAGGVSRTGRGKEAGEEFSGLLRGETETKGRREVQRQGDGGGRVQEGGMQGCRRERGARGVGDECRGGRQHKAEPEKRGHEDRGCIGWMSEDSEGIAGWQGVTGCSRVESGLIEME